MRSSTITWRIDTPRSLPRTRARNAAEQSGQHKLVERIHRVPVGQSEQPDGIECRRLANQRPGAVGGDVEFEPRAPRQLHFGGEPETRRRIACFDPPEIHRISKCKLFGIPPRATHAGTTDQLIEPSPQPPEPVAVIPAVATAEASDGAEDIL